VQLLIDLRLSYSVISTGLILVGFFWNNLTGFIWNYVALIVGIFFANVFVFIVNDYYDAAHDSKDSIKRNRNVFCSNETRSIGKVVIYLSLSLSLVFGAMASLSSLSILLIFNLSAFIYSAPPIKLRDRPYGDWVSILLWKGLIIYAGYVYFFGFDPFIGDFFIYSTLFIILLLSLIAQLDNQLRDFVVDESNMVRHSIQRLGYRKSLLLNRVLIIIFFAFSFIFSVLSKFYITAILIILNITIYYFVMPENYSHVLDFVHFWIISLFLEHFMPFFSYRQQLLFSAWVLVMIGLAILHVKRTNLFGVAI